MLHKLNIHRTSNNKGSRATMRRDIYAPPHYLLWRCTSSCILYLNRSSIHKHIHTTREEEEEDMHAPGEKEPYTQSQCITWQVAGEAINGLGTSRAVLLQLAHPLVAAGVYEHSSYFSDPIGRACRTFTLGQFLTFGNSTQARQAAHTINKLHHHVHGTLKSDAGSFAQGTRYNAHDPELLLWVYATLIDTVLVTYPLFVQPLSEEQQEQYYQESKQLARLVGIPPQYLPETVTQLRQYMYEMIYSERLAATPEGRALAQVVLYPPLHSALRPFMHLNQYITSALLPEPVRQIFDLRWSRKRQQIFDLATTTMRTIIPHLPIALRMLPLTRSLLNEQISTHAS